jgi:hypothetical protein
MWNRFCPLTQSDCIDGLTNKSELVCSLWDSVNGECTIITQALYSVIYYRVVLSRLEGVENPLDIMTPQ